MTSNEIRQSFLDFFEFKQHSIVPSASLMPDAPNLLFTNAGMNQFVPYFLGDREPPYPRAADTQKCIRAGGKHNDLEDVGLDTYHHTFFEMLGNWSFGDYFKQEAIEWAWELITEVWKFPKERLYASVYKPGDGDPAEFDHEAYDFWKAVFEKAGLDPETHIVYGNKADNFWMMGDTGPCGPCSELHVDLTPEGDTRGKLVNADSPYCIEIWNLVFIQFNATPDGDLVPLKSRHVDTGMGFERVAGIMATSKNFTDFSAPPSNYNSDLFTSIFEKLESLSGHAYQRTLPEDLDNISETEMKDVIFRVLADHARCLSCSIADGILPGNEGRNYVLRRILRRAVMYGRKIGLEKGFFAGLVPTVAEKLGPVFLELDKQKEVVQRIIESEEDSFGRTLDRGIQLFEKIADYLEFVHSSLIFTQNQISKFGPDNETTTLTALAAALDSGPPLSLVSGHNKKADTSIKQLFNHCGTNFEGQIELVTNTNAASILSIPGPSAFELYDTYGFPIDLTQLLAKQRGISVDIEGFESEMEKQRERARASQKKSDILVSEGESAEATIFTGYDQIEIEAEVLEVRHSQKGEKYLIFDTSPFYAEMGGQVGDTGRVRFDGQEFNVVDTTKDSSGRILHQVVPIEGPDHEAGGTSDFKGKVATLSVSQARRKNIERHHSATHVLHWALREVLGSHVRQAGSYVDDKRLRFDFSHFEGIPSDQIAEIESLCNERLLENSPCRWYETPFDQKPEDVIAFFGDKYGDTVRVVDIGGFSKELCGGTHVRATGEIGLLHIASESAISAGTRRIEAIVGPIANDYFKDLDNTLSQLANSLSVPASDIVKRVDSLIARISKLEKQLKAFQQKAAGNIADDLASNASVKDSLKLVASVVDADNPNALRQLGANVHGKLGEGVVVLGSAINGKASLVAFSSPEAIAAGHKAGDIIRSLTSLLDGKGGGKPDFAMGGGANVAKLKETVEGFTI